MKLLLSNPQTRQDTYDEHLELPRCIALAFERHHVRWRLLRAPLGTRAPRPVHGQSKHQERSQV